MKYFLVYNSELHPFATVQAAESGFYNLAEDHWHNMSFRTKQTLQEFIRIQRATIVTPRGSELILMSQHRPFHGWVRTQNATK